MGIVAFLLKNKSLVVIGIVLAMFAGSGVYIKILKSEKATLTAEKATLATELQVSQTSVKDLQQSIIKQNESIDKLKADADIRAAKNDAEVKKAKVLADNYKKQAEDLLNRKPPQGMPKCDAASALILEELKNARK